MLGSVSLVGLFGVKSVVNGVGVKILDDWLVEDEGGE